MRIDTTEYLDLEEFEVSLQEALLREGELELEGLIPWSSNYTFLASARAPRRIGPVEAGCRFLAIYKPCRGERPLWDFETAGSERSGSLSHREVAAYTLSRYLGWPSIPTVVFRDGPHGLGSVQTYVDADLEEHYFTMRAEADLATAFHQIVLFDYLVNNADRKGGHLLKGAHGRLWAIDHGLTFHVEYKLRTVIWDYAGQPIPQPLLSDVERLDRELRRRASSLLAKLQQFIAAAEIVALQRRVAQLLRWRAFPMPRRHWRNVPYPLI